MQPHEPLQNSDNWQVFYAGFGLAALIGLAPLCAFVYWFTKTFATEDHVAQGDVALSKRLDNSEARLRLLEMKQERHTVVLEHLTQSINQLNLILQSFAPGRPALIVPHQTPPQNPGDQG